MAQNKPVAQSRKVIDVRLDEVSVGLIIVMHWHIKHTLANMLWHATVLHAGGKAMA